MTLTPSDPVMPDAYDLKGRVIRKKPAHTKTGNGTSITMGFPVCEVSEYVDPQTVKDIFEQNERATIQKDAADLERVIEALDNAIFSIEAYSAQAQLDRDQKDQAQKDMDQCEKALSIVRGWKGDKS